MGHSHSSAVHLDPGIVQGFADQLVQDDGPPLYAMSPADARHVLLRLQQNTPVILEHADVHDYVIPSRWGKVLLRVVRPATSPEEPLPIVMYYHGGGWILGDRRTHHRLIRQLANDAHAAIVFVEYSRAPESQYPTQIEQAYVALSFVARFGDELNLDTSRLAVAGDSVGGNMATVVAMLAKQRGGPHICAQLLFYPVTDANFDTESYQTFAQGPWLTRKAMQWFWDAYLPDAKRRAEPTASPLRASLDQLHGLPQTLLLTDENDVLRDEGEAYARRLASAGVPVVHVRYLGTMHDFMMLNPLAESQPTQAAIAQATDYLRRVFWHPTMDE